jgi:hypothetical protein
VAYKIMCILAGSARWIVIAAFCFVFGVFGYNQLRLLYLSHIPPITFYDMVIDPDVVASGDPIFVTAVLYRHRYCHSDRDEFIADVATNTNHWQMRFANASTTLGPVRIRNKYMIPPLEPGEYVLRMVGFYRCSDGDAHTVHGPEARFTVKP